MHAAMPIECGFAEHDVPGFVFAGSIPTVKVLTAQKGAAAIVALQEVVLSTVLDS